MALNRVVPGAQASGSNTGSHTGNRVENNGPNGLNGMDRPQAAGNPIGLAAISSGQRARWTLGKMAGRSATMERLFLQMRYLAKHLRLALIEGERGTGKLLTAETLHGLGSGSGFVACPAEQFLCSGAAEIEQARGGTLYLSRVEMLNHEQQGQLLHLLQWVQQQHALSGREGRGGALLRPGPVQPEHAIATPRAVIVSSERALRPLVLYGKFRGDLYQQLSAVQLLLPPLRDRREDVAMLVELFVARFAEQYGKPMRGVAQDVLPHLLAYNWPGNVGELETVVSRAARRAEGEWLRGSDIVLPATDPAGHTGLSLAPALVSGPQWAPRAIEMAAPRQDGSQQDGLQRRTIAGAGQPAPGPVESMDAESNAAQHESFDPNLDHAILRHIRRVLAGVDGNKLRAARLLGISRSTLYRLLDGDAASGRPLETGAMQAPRMEPRLGMVRQQPMLEQSSRQL